MVVMMASLVTTKIHLKGLKPRFTLKQNSVSVDKFLWGRLKNQIVLKAWL